MASLYVSASGKTRRMHLAEAEVEFGADVQPQQDQQHLFVPEF
jgi:hypothetical protein